MLIAPNDYYILKEYALSLNKLGEKKKALDFMEKAGQLCPNNKDI